MRRNLKRPTKTVAAEVQRPSGGRIIREILARLIRRAVEFKVGGAFGVWRFLRFALFVRIIIVCCA